MAKSGKYDEFFNTLVTASKSSGEWQSEVFCFTSYPSGNTENSKKKKLICSFPSKFSRLRSWENYIELFGGLVLCIAHFWPSLLREWLKPTRNPPPLSLSEAFGKPVPTNPSVSTDPPGKLNRLSWEERNGLIERVRISRQEQPDSEPSQIGQDRRIGSFGDKTAQSRKNRDASQASRHPSCRQHP